MLNQNLHSGEVHVGKIIDGTADFQGTVLQGAELLDATTLSCCLTSSTD